MQPESILKADVLDIIFENRNKKYGAYDLRKHYQRYVLRSICISAGLVTIILFFITRNVKHNIPGGIEIPPIALIDPPVNKIDPIPEASKAPRQPIKAVAVVGYIVPQIVNAIAPIDPPMPEMDDIGEKQISNVNSPGGSGDITQPSNNGALQGSAIMEEPKNDGPLYSNAVDEQAEYPGGLVAMQNFLQRNLRDPREEDQESGTVKVKIRFVVEEDGSIGRFEILSTGGEIVDHEVLRVLHKMPKWKPAKKNGKTVAMYFVQPITFTVPGD
ncbi:MAG: hypothetical protein C5B52_05265 [Bacteroidetes bacterium]|nr:MAG: hypothetical protein C5B52_05265 [Bacteroidota bacterium]